MCWSDAAIAKSRVKSRKIAARACPRWVSAVWSSAPRATEFSPRRLACARTFRQDCFANCWPRPPRSCGRGCLPQHSRNGRRKSAACLTRLQRRWVGVSVHAIIAQRIVLGLQRSGRMNEAALAAFANDGKYEETIAGLAALSKVPLKITDRLMSSERTDPALILCKAAGMSWPTVKAVITICANANRGASQNLDAAFVNYGRLSDATAQRVVRFWQVKQNA